LNQAVLDRVVQVLNDERHTLIAKESCHAAALLRKIEEASTKATPREAVNRIRQPYHSAELAPSKVEETKPPYRNTREIISFAAKFYRSRVAEDEEAVHLPSEADIQQLPSGQIPQLIQFSAPQDQIKWLSDQVVRIVDTNEWQPDQILILLEDSAQVDICVEFINRKHAGLAINAKEKGHTRKVRVCSINATTGLEAPLVFILGLDRIFEKEDSLQHDPEDRPELILRNTRKIYMALTRAMSNLVVLFHQKSVRPF